MEQLVRIWSNEHRAWWRPDARGYTNKIEDAGLYILEDAERICRQAGFDDGIPNETIYPQ